MRRNVTLKEISDGRVYGKNDMVKADCHGCKNCSKCCHGMGKTIVLDSYDVYRMTTGMGRSFQELLEAPVELSVVEGVILPNLRMEGEEQKCGFLNEQGWCSIHPYRPGLCRLFPLGRIYENGDFKFFLQNGECMEPHTKVKVAKWIDTPDFERNKVFILCWHDLLQDLMNFVKDRDVIISKKMNLLFLNTFYLAPYDSTVDFYEQFEERYATFRQLMTKGAYAELEEGEM